VLCPKCHQPIDPTAFICSNQHQFHSENGVLNLLDEGLRQQIDLIYQHRAQVARKLPEIADDDYNHLPYALAAQHFEWQMRAYDADVVLKLLKSRPRQTVLEIGAWNGWLTHLIAEQGNTVTAVDYFAHPTDGLGAKQHYRVQWSAVKMDITDLSLFEQQFDVIVINHGLHFFPDPVGYVEQVRRLVAPGGLLILIGLTFFRDPTNRRAQVKNLVEQSEKDFGHSLFIKPTRGYMDFADKAKLQAMGIRLYQHRQLWKANLKGRLITGAPAYFYGVEQV
jgi:2-polyprenyl-3-methyl-5-hydroxy-6-metoxy-1,4-benzoquinol methylase